MHICPFEILFFLTKVLTAFKCVFWLFVSFRSQVNVKEEPEEDPDFVTKGKAKKRKRKVDNTDGPSSTSEAPL